MLGRPPHRIAEIGIGRTFQNLALFAPQSVLDNVRIGGHARSRSDFVSDTLRLPWVRRHEAALTETAWSLIHMLDLEEVALRPAGGLPLGTRKRVELARALGRQPEAACCSTSRRAGSITGRSASSARSSAGSATSARSPCCLSSIT